jgi:predicted kinase
MRKWMRDRLKRRKKTDPKADDSKTSQAPLQPAYFEAREGATSEASEKEVAPASEDRDEGSSELSAPEPGNSLDDTADGQQAMIPRGDSAQKKRRRRGRGGRGRGRGREPRPSAEPIAPTAAGDEVPQVPRSRPAPGEATAAGRPPKGVVILAIGLPGSGKSSWFKRHNVTPLSSDMLRALLFDDAQEQRFQDLVFSNLRSMLKARLIARRPMNYVDATNLTPQERHNWVKLAKDYGYEAQAVFFDVPLEVCLERNKKRSVAVEEEVMRRMSGKLRAPAFEEGFSKITVVRVKKKDNQVAS